MDLLTTIVIGVAAIASKNSKYKVRSKRASAIVLTIMGLMAALLFGYLGIDYFRTATDLDSFHILEKVHDEKGIVVYTALEDGEEQYIILKEGAFFDKVFLQTKFPVAEAPWIIDAETYKYNHRIEMDNGIINHTYKKRWGDGVLSFWVLLIAAIYSIPEGGKFSKTDKIIGALWLMISICVTVSFIF